MKLMMLPTYNDDGVLTDDGIIFGESKPSISGEHNLRMELMMLPTYNDDGVLTDDGIVGNNRGRVKEYLDNIEATG